MLKGTLDEFELSEVLRLLAGGLKTGHLAISGRSGYGRIYLRDGVVCTAQSSLAREPIGQKLVRARALEEAHLWQALERARASASRLGEALVGSGSVTQEQIDTALKEQVEDDFINILRVDPEAFEWQTREVAECQVQLNVDALISSATKTLDELEEMRRRIPDEQALLSLSPALEMTPEGVRLDREEWRVLALLSGRRAIKDLIRYSGLGEVQTLRTLNRMIGNGLIEFARPGETSPASPQSPVKGQSPRLRHTLEEETETHSAEEWQPSQSTGSPPATGVVPPPLPEARVVPPVIEEPPPEPPMPPSVIDLEAPPPEIVIPEAPPKHFEIVLVCTGNRIRSPITEAFVRQLTAGLPVEVRSVGVQDLGEVGAVDDAIESAAELGVDISHHASRQMTPGELADADLVIGFEWFHLERAVLRGGAPRDRVFTLPELVALLEHVEVPAVGDPIERARRVVTNAQNVRRGDISRPDKLEIIDPLGRPPRAYRDTAARLLSLTRRLVPGLFGSVSTPSSQPRSFNNG